MSSDAFVRIAIDGPSGAGKSTIARRIADILDIDYIDTGAMYRAIALKLIKSGIDASSEPERLAQMLDDTTVDIDRGTVLLDGEDVSAFIRSPDVTAEASRSSAISSIREKLVSLQRDMGTVKSVVMDGRDIGTNVLTGAEYKFYMTACPEERARRRFKELIDAGSNSSYEDVLTAILKRDYDDSHRALNPLKKAEDAILIDTDDLDIDEVTDLILTYIKE